MTMRFLLAAWDGGGAIPPQLALMSRLIARGHEVRVLADPTVEPEARAAGCSFSSWTTAPHRLTRRKEDDILKDWAARSPLEHLDNMLRDFFAAPIPRWTADVSAELDRFDADVVLADFLLPGAFVAAEARGVPGVLIVHTPYGFKAEGIPPFGGGLLPAKNALQRLRDKAIHAIMDRFFWGRALPALNAERRARGLDEVPSVYSQFERLARTLVLTSPAFDFTSPHVPGNVRWVGGALEDPSWADPFTTPWPAEDARPLVLVGLSSTFMNQAPLLRRVVDALSALPVRAVVTLGPTVSPEEVRGTENVCVVASAPHGPLLREAALLVSHCGHGTTIKAMSAGVPMVCIPMGRDQGDCAVRVVSRGAGVLVKKTASAAEIRRAVRDALANPSLREAAATMSAAIARAEGQADAVAELESLRASKSPPRVEARPHETGAK